MVGALTPIITFLVLPQFLKKGENSYHALFSESNDLHIGISVSSRLFGHLGRPKTSKRLVVGKSFAGAVRSIL